jgi:hypothetical protein
VETLGQIEETPSQLGRLGVPFTLGCSTDAARTSGDGARNSRHANGSNVVSGGSGCRQRLPNNHTMNANAVILYCTLVYFTVGSGTQSRSLLRRSRASGKHALASATATPETFDESRDWRPGR